ncbi:hypothetical protein BUE80_DR004961 [Diplocarpon rosae]|nr:hypothetical protein BUE80_DR004961 [Diplocarpon rosae]
MSVEKDIFLDVTHDEDVRKAIGLIYTLKVSPPEHRLLVSFVRDAVDAKATALYVLKRIYRRGQDEVDVQTELQALLLEWRSVVERFYTDKQVPTYVSTQVSVRDRNACCITGQTRVWWDIFGWSRLVYLQVVPETILSDEDTESSPGLVSIFLTDEKLAQLSKDIKGESIWSQLRNTWTLRQDVAAACKIGLFMTPGWNQARKPLEDLKAMCVLSGLVDFGCAGFYPEYWEFTKAMFSVFGDDPASKDLIETTFGDRYLDEFEAEKKLWKVNSTF